MALSAFVATLRQRWRRYLVEATVFLVVIMLIHFWQTRHVPAGPAPEITGVMADGSHMTLCEFRARHPGRPVAIHFWAEWCPICRAEESSIDALRNDHPVLTVAMQSGTAPIVSQVLNARQLSWPTLVDAEGKISQSYGVQAVPAFVVVDPAGQLRFFEPGYTTQIGMRLRLWWAQQFP